MAGVAAALWELARRRYLHTRTAGKRGAWAVAAESATGTWTAVARQCRSGHPTLQLPLVRLAGMGAPHQVLTRCACTAPTACRRAQPVPGGLRPHRRAHRPLLGLRLLSLGKAAEGGSGGLFQWARRWGPFLTTGGTAAAAAAAAGCTPLCCAGREAARLSSIVQSLRRV